MLTIREKILLDDNFASVVPGVREGRLIFNNLRRSIQYTLTHIMPEVLPQILYVVVPIPLPLPAILVLVIDLGFELALALSFAFDKPESEEALMRQQPRKPVNDRSVRALREKALRRVQTRARTDEEGRFSPPSKLRQTFEKIKAPFTRAFWQEKFQKTDDEKLVDMEVLLYAYIWGGLIETFFVLLAYFIVFFHLGFTPTDLKNAQSSTTTYFKTVSPPFVNSRGRSIDGWSQRDALAQAQSIVYLGVFIQQCFNCFAVKARYRPPFGKNVIGNPFNFYGILAGASLAMFIVYVPPLQSVFGGSVHLSPLWWLIPFGGGASLLVMSTLRVIIMRKGLMAQQVDDTRLNLNMVPTRRTMSIRPISDPEKKLDRS